MTAAGEEAPWNPEETRLLVRAAQGGDRSALESLFERYLPRVRRIASLRLGWRLRRLLEVDDIVQDALLLAFARLDDFRETSEGSFRSWLAACVEREIVRQSRRAGARKRGDGKLVPMGDADSFVLGKAIRGTKDPSPSEMARASEEEERLEAAILSLPEKHRQLIVLRWICGMSHAEIARRVGYSEESASRTAVTRALHLLRRKLGEEEAGPR